MDLKQQKIQQLLHRFWGYETFRFPQAEVIDCLLGGQDGIVVMPTGGGKSICFQLPALFQQGLTLVVSPLIALMENQVQELKERALPAACLHGELARSERKTILSNLQQNRLRLLYVSPETLLSPVLWEILCHPQIKITGLMIDEAHCLVEWGDSFRPAYQRLGSLRPALLAHKPDQLFSIAAFTATADPTTQTQLQALLQLNNPQVFTLSPYRSNLWLMVKIAWTVRCRQHLLLQFIQHHPRQSGLIYTRSRRECEELAQWLTTKNYRTAAYHGGLGANQRREIEQGWLTGQLPFVVCTNAFGLGINKPDIRWIAHFHPPHLLSEYLQEIGRAGRDGLPANCLTLVSEPTGWLDPTDQQRRHFFNQQRKIQYQNALAIAQQIPDQGELLSLKKSFPDVEMSLALLCQLGQLQWLDPFRYQLLPKSSSRPTDLKTLLVRLSGTTLRHYLYTQSCRWAFLLTAFGLQNTASFRCGHCDRCCQKNPSDRKP
ncbi:MAG: ATP-dependent DNA helicase RecQ [Snowella sp.]|nr:ATP-dependent DNA helicase RecQ [Snowella sp.]